MIRKQQPPTYRHHAGVRLVWHPGHVLNPVEEVFVDDRAESDPDVRFEAEVGELLAVDEIDRWMSAEGSSSRRLREASGCHEHSMFGARGRCITLGQRHAPMFEEQAEEELARREPRWVGVRDRSRNCVICA